jgi:GT2 family glycosyltransferase
MIAVITLSRNGRYLARGTSALIGQVNPPPYRQFLVDNGIGLGHRETTDCWRVFKPGWNSHFGEAHNMIVPKIMNAFPDTTHLLLLNDDAEMAPTCMAELWKTREACGEGHHIVGTKIIQRDGKLNHAGVRVWPGLMDHIGRGEDPAKYHGAPAVQAVTFACVLIDVPLYRELKGFDERYVWSFEDTDFCLRAMEAGATIRCDRDSLVIHDECGTRPRGGQRDVTNSRIFHKTWPLDRIVKSFRAYQTRLGEPVELQ